MGISSLLTLLKIYEGKKINVVSCFFKHMGEMCNFFCRNRLTLLIELTVQNYCWVTVRYLTVSIKRQDKTNVKSFSINCSIC